MKEEFPKLPEGVLVFRANGEYVCLSCNRRLYDHPKFRYPWEDSENFAVLGCDGVYYHL